MALEWEWRVYYTEDSFTPSEIKYLTTEDCEPAEVPGCGILGIAIKNERVGWQLLRGYDRYIYDLEAFGGWCGLDRIGWIDYVSHARRPVIIKFGRNIPQSEWEKFIQFWLPEKSGYLPGEKR